MNPSMREVRYSDCVAVGELKRRNGFTVKWSTDRWVGLWRENPAMPNDQGVPMGWVLEQAGNVVGYLGNVPMHYQFKGKRLLAAAARGFAVDTACRSHSLRLAAAFVSQKNVDLLLVTSANGPAAAVFQLCKTEKIPYSDYDKALYWIINSKQFADSALRKYGFSGVVAAIAGAVPAWVIHIERLLRRRGPPGNGAAYDMSILEPGAIGAEFDEFWQRTLEERSECILAERSARVLRWHFGHRAAGARQAKFICARSAGKLVGYAVLTREDSEEIGLMRSRIVDLIAERDAPELIDTLLYAAYQQARADGSHMLELIGFPARIRARLVAGRAFSRPLPSWPFWYKAVATGLCNGRLKQEDAWYGSSYDGDASL